MCPKIAIVSEEAHERCHTHTHGTFTALDKEKATINYSSRTETGFAALETERTHPCTGKTCTCGLSTFSVLHQFVLVSIIARNQRTSSISSKPLIHCQCQCVAIFFHEFIVKRFFPRLTILSTSLNTFLPGRYCYEANGMQNKYRLQAIIGGVNNLLNKRYLFPSISFLKHVNCYHADPVNVWQGIVTLFGNVSKTRFLIAPAKPKQQHHWKFTEARKKALLNQLLLKWSSLINLGYNQLMSSWKWTKFSFLIPHKLTGFQPLDFNVNLWCKSLITNLA